MNHEAEFIRRFVIPQKQRRYLSLLETRKGRKKLVEALDHFDELDPRYAQLLPANAQTVNQIEALLKRKGAPERCYVTSSNGDIDDREMALSEALQETVGSGSGTIVSCIPGKLAYFEGEEQNQRYILEHTE
ncbi:MAG TPA: hypothetical protein VJ124_26045 [Pyrinomonadaceae bacterium]|nr:hypothetical protein [Pyrinomonadaceae bacterium]